MNELDRKNLWFVEILQKEKLKEMLYTEILEDDQIDTNDISWIVNILKAVRLHGNSIEDNRALFKRAIRIKFILELEIIWDKRIEKLIKSSSKNKILIVTH